MSNVNSRNLKGVYLTAVKEALEQLTLTREEAQGNFTISYARFRNPDTDGEEHIEIPVDSEPPQQLRVPELSTYISKYMEYVQTFLVANRLKGFLLPAGQDLSQHVRNILSTLTAGSEGNASYVPKPHVQAASVEAPFVDFAGFVIILLTDYLRWAPPDEPLREKAKSEAEQALRFLINENTFLEGNDGIGWSFVSKEFCSTTYRESPLHYRHVYPTARAVVAIHRYLASPDADVALAAQAREILPRVLKWIAGLNRGYRLFYASDVDEPPHLPDHIYATECLITLATPVKSAKKELPPLDGASKVANEAVSLLLAALEEGNSYPRTTNLGSMETTSAFSVFLNDRPEPVLYKNRSTPGTCLVVLAQAIELAEGQVEEWKRIRALCTDMLRSLFKDHRNPKKLWPRDRVQFHWILSAIEAILRFSQHIPRVSIKTSKEELIQAVDLLMQDEEVIRLLRRKMRDKVLEVGADIEPLDDIDLNID